MDRVREREEIESPRNIPGKRITLNLDRRLLHAPEVLGRPSQPQADLAVRRVRGTAAGSPSPHSQSSAGSSVRC